MQDAAHWLEALRGLDIDRPVRIMNVCGGHERSISLAGLRTAIPDNIELIPGPGCPVCICPEEDVYEAIQIALHEDVTLVAFGDMLRVPVNVPKRESRTLEQAKAAGADIRPIASPTEAVRIANADPNRTVVFFAAGFETTTAPTASMLAEGAPDNLLVLLSGRLTWPAVAMLLDSETPGFDALVAPGHVATVMGPEEWQFVIDQHDIPAAVAGLRVAVISTIVIRRWFDPVAIASHGSNSRTSWRYTTRTGVVSESFQNRDIVCAKSMRRMMHAGYFNRMPTSLASVSERCHRAAIARA